MLLLTGFISAVKVNNETTANLSLNGDLDLWPLWVGDYRRLVYPCICAFCCEAIEGLLAGSWHQRVHQKTLTECLYTALFKLTWVQTLTVHTAASYQEDKKKTRWYISPRVFCVVSVISSRPHFQVSTYCCCQNSQTPASEHFISASVCHRQSGDLPPNGAVCSSLITVFSWTQLISFYQFCTAAWSQRPRQNWPLAVGPWFYCSSRSHTHMHVCTVCVYS